MRIAVTGGGTGGHIFPNLSIIDELRKRGVNEIVWIGGKGGKEQAWAQKAKVPFYGITAGKLRRYFSLRNFSDLFRIALGVLQSTALLARMRPDLIFSKGGFVSVPPVLAARLLGTMWTLRIPWISWIQWIHKILGSPGIKIPGLHEMHILTHESDINPGLATKIIARSAVCVCVSFEKTKSSFSGVRTECTGNPVRDVIKNGDRKKGLVFLGFRQRLPVVLVLGGSLGARSLNGAVREMLKYRSFRFNLVHQCGGGNYDPGFPNEGRYRQFEFIDEEMGNVLAASDLVVSRSGAGALYEIGFMKKPSILVPLPRSKSRGEQIENAKHFTDNGAALLIEDELLSGNELHKAITALLEDKKKLKEMGGRAASLCVSGAEARIADLIEEAVKKKA